MKHSQKKINNFFFAIFALFLILGAAVPAAAETSIVWSQEIGNVAAADMSEDGSVIYAAVGSQVFVYDAAGVQQNVFTVGGTVVKLVCTADGSKAALYTDGNEVYYIDSGAVTWSETFTAITDIDISNVGSVLIVESTVFHKYLSDGSLDYNSSSGTYDLGVIDPQDDFAIVQNGNINLDKYIITTTHNYWGIVNNNTFNTNFSGYQNVLILTVNENNAIILNNQTLGDDVWNELYNNLGTDYRYYAVSNGSLSQTDAYNYFFWNGGDVWQQTTSAGWTARVGACSWVFDNKMWIGGGMDSLNSGYAHNDVWYSSDGITWTRATSSAEWSARVYACSWVFDNKIWIGGGKTSSASYFHDVWYSSDGVTWTSATSSAGWAGRAWACSWVFDNKLWIGGGYGGSAARDVWYSSDGVTWTRATSSAGWSARHGACSWVFDNKMWIGGGSTSQTTGSTVSGINDLWYSSDGVTWTQAEYTGDISLICPCGWVFDNKLWIGGGGTGFSTRTNNVANYITTYPNIQIQPHSYGDTWLFYNYIGTAPQHTQTTYTGAIPYSGVAEIRTKPELSIYNLQTSKSFTGNITAISLSARGDWLGTATTANIYHDQITSSGFGTEYYAALGSTGTIYDIATANSAAMSILGQGQITDIYSMSASRVGTYTAGGAVTHVDIADKSALWAASGGEDGKVYVFSKDESSNWYLEYSSDSEDPITALKMSSRGEFVLAGRTGSLTLYQTNTPEQADTNFWFTLYIYKDSDSYRQAAVNVSVYNINNQWQSFAEGLTDSSGKYVIQLTAGNTYKFDVANGQKVLVYQAAPSVPSQVVSIHTSPVSAALTYEAEWDPEIGGVTFDYMDSTGQTQTVIVKIIRTDTWETVYEQIYTGQQSIEQSVPIVDDTVGYKVELSASRSSGITRNTWFVSSSRDIVPIPLDTNIKNILFSCFLIFLAGLFSYLSAFRGAIVVCLSAIFFTYMGWLTIPWHWLVVAVVLAFVAGFTQRRT